MRTLWYSWANALWRALLHPHFAGLAFGSALIGFGVTMQTRAGVLR